MIPQPQSHIQSKAKVGPLTRHVRVTRFRFNQPRLGARLLVCLVCWILSLEPTSAQPFAPPPKPDVAPLIGKTYSNDTNRDRIDDQLADKTAQALSAQKSAQTQSQRTKAQAQLDAMVDVELVFQEQITQKQIDDFLAQGGQITYIYKAVSYGWNGRIPLVKAATMTALMGTNLVLIQEARPMQLHMDTATRTGRVRPIWASGFAGNGVGFDGDNTITIGIVDTGVDESHTDLNGRRVYWRDFSTDASASPIDIGQHGSHVAGIALGTGAAGGFGTGTMYYSDKNSLNNVSGWFPNPIELPAASVTVSLTARWNGGGSTSLGLAYHPKGNSSGWALQGSLTSGTSPLTTSLTFVGDATRAYSAYLPGNGNTTITDYVITSQVSGYPGVGDGFNTFRGVAPGCNWAGAKVFDNAGNGTSSAIGDGVDDLVANRVAKNIKVMNLSLGTIGSPGINTSHRQKINSAVNNGIVVVVSAGNDGGVQEVDDPGRAAMALTVAAANDVNQLTGYTSEGFASPGSSPGQEEDYKPDLMAPGGSAIYYSSLLSVDSNSGDGPAFGDQQPNDYYNIQGTSMASPFAAGCAALVIDALQQSGITWDFGSSQHSRYIKMVLCATASESNSGRESALDNPTLDRDAAGPNGFPVGKDQYEGFGMINPDAAVQAVSQTFVQGSTVTGTLGPSVTDPRAWARTVSLTAGQTFAPTLTVPAGGDFDLYLYSAIPSAYGTPTLLASSALAGNGVTESINYTAASSGNALLVVKRVSGSGTFQLNSLIPLVNHAPVGTDAAVTMLEDAAYTFSASNFGFSDPNDSPPNNFNRVKVTTVPGAGSLKLSGTAVVAGSFVTVANIPNLTFTPATNGNGNAYTSFTFQVEDDGGTANGGANLDPTPRALTINVTPVNDPPTLGAISNLTTNEDAGTLTVNLAGVSAGGSESQTLTVTAVSSNPALIPNPTVAYTSPNSTGSLTLTPPTNANGSATITVVVQDNGGTANGGVDSKTNTFSVTVNAVNDAPTLDAISNLTINEDAGATNISLTGIGPGPDSGQSVTNVTASSSNPGLIPNPSVAYTSGNTTGSLSFAPVANSNGVATISVVVQDNGGTANGGVNAKTNTFLVTVNSVNDAPTFTKGANQSVAVNAGALTVVNWATAISAGPPNEASQALNFIVTNNNNGLFALQPAVSAIGTLAYTPAANSSGVATVSVRLHDDGGTANGGVDTSAEQTFTITVTNLPPVVASFTGSPTNGTAPLIVVFTNLSSGATNYSWDFGDGRTSLAVNPTNTYTNAGSYTVSLTAIGAAGTNFLARTNYLVVTNPPPVLVISPTNCVFNTLIVGQSSTQTVQVINTGGLTLAGSANTATPFSVVSGSPFNVPVGQTSLVQVAFSPTQAGSFGTNLIFTSNGGNQTNALSGIAVTPGSIVVSPASTNYGTVLVGTNALATFVVTNTGGAAVSNGVASVGSGPFSLASGGSFSLAGFGWTNVVVRFTPLANGSFSTNVIFTSSGGNSTNLVSGAGQTPGQIAVTPGNWNFGWVAVGSNATRMFVVTNSGGATVTGGTVSVSPPFSVLSGSNFIVAGFGTTNVVVQFAPTNAGTFSNNVLFSSVNGGSVTNPVTGNSAVTPAASFAASPTSGSLPLMVTFTDISSGTITNRLWNFGDGGPTNTASTNIVHIYNFAGTNTVSLVVSGPLGANTNSQLGYIVVTNLPPVITGQPQNQTVAVGGTANFTVTATGTPPLGYQWQFNGTNLVNGGRISGASSSALTLSSVQTNDAGNYSVFVSNVAATVPSSPALLTVTEGSGSDLVYDFSTLAGMPDGPGSADGSGSAARFFFPSGAAVDNAGNMFVADTYNHTIRKVTPAGLVTTMAGLAGSAGSSDGTGSVARFYRPAGVAVDSAGNVYVADSFNSTIRKMTPAGVVTTLAGFAGEFGSSDGTGSAARFSVPLGVAVDGAGNVFVADVNGSTIRKVTLGGVVTTVAGLAGSQGSADGTGNAARFSQPHGVAVDGAGNVFIADTGNNTIRKMTSAGVVTTLAGLAGNFGSRDGTGSGALFNSPNGVTVNSAGEVFVADTANNAIRKVTAAGVVTTVAGAAGGTEGSQDGTGSAARFSRPEGVTVNSAGEVFVADTVNNTIRKVTAVGVVTTLAGMGKYTGSQDGTGSAARFNYPTDAAVDSTGNVFVADSGNSTIRKVTSAAVVSTLAGSAGVQGSTDGTSAALFKFPRGVAVDSTGNVFVADKSNHTIRKVTPMGVVTTLAGLTGNYGSQDGTGSAARFNWPNGVTVDSASNVYVADSINNTIRKVTSAGVVTTLAGLAGVSGTNDGTGNVARFNFYPYGHLAVDSAGNVFVADYSNHTIRKVTPAGMVTTLAGNPGMPGSADGTGSAARFYNPYGVAADSVGNVFVADSYNNTIRKISPTGVVSTIGGWPGQKGHQDGVGSAARFSSPSGISVDASGRLYIADPDQNVIRIGTPVPVPVAIFTATPIVGGPPLAVTFTDTSTGVITNRFWNFGDGTTTNTTVTNLSHIYNATGSYSVQLIVAGPSGASTNNQSNLITLGTAPQLAVSPGSLGYGTLVVGQSSDQNFKVINTGDFPLTGTVSLVTGGTPFTLSTGSFNLAGHQTNTVIVTFSPLAAGNFSNQVVFLSNGGNLTNVVNGIGVSAAHISVIPANLDFGTVVLGNYVYSTFLVSNLGGAPLSNGIATVGAPFTITSGGTFNLPGFASTNVIIRFTPASAGSISNSVLFTTSNAGNSTNVATGTAVTPGQIAVTPTNWNFGWVAVGSNATCSFVVTNSGGATVTGGAVSVSPPFSVISGSNFTVAGFGATNVVVQFAPTNAGTFSNNVLFSSVNGGSVTNPVTGNSAVTPAASFAASPTSGSVPLTVTFTDTSTGTITNRFWTFGDGGTLSTNATNVVYAYSLAGTNTVSLTVSGPVGTNTLMRNGYVVVTNLPPLLTVTPASRDFGSVLTGMTAQVSFTISNAGGAMLTGSASVLTPFAIASGSPFSLAGSAATNVVVRFTPLTVGSFTNTVIFASNGGDSTNTATGVAVSSSASFIGLGGVALGIQCTRISPDGSVVVGYHYTNGYGQRIADKWTRADGWRRVANFDGVGRTNEYSGPSDVSLGGNCIVGGFMPNTNLPGAQSGSYWGFAAYNDGSLLVFSNCAIERVSGDGTTFATEMRANDGSGRSFGTYLFSNPTNFQQIVPPILDGLFTTLFVDASSNLDTFLYRGTWFDSSVGYRDRAYVWRASTGIVNIGDIGGFGITRPWAISGDGKFIVGYGGGLGGTRPAFRWSQDQGFLSLGILPGYYVCTAQAVSDDGAIVAGNAYNDNDEIDTFIWKAEFGMLRLRDLLAGWGVSITGWTNLAMTDMSADGTVIIGNGINQQGSNDAWIATIPAALFPTLQVNFSASPTAGVAPLAVTFADLSTGLITNRFWNFGDGTTTNTTTTSLSHIYNATGSYNVQLIVTGPSGASTNTKLSLITLGSAPQLAVSPASLDYGTLVVGQSSDQNFEVINTGDLPLTGTVSLATGGTPFTLSCGSFNVSGHQTNTITVTFNPLAAGNFSNQVVFLSNGGNVTNAVSGIGVSLAHISVNPANLDFGTVVLGNYVYSTFLVSNLGGAPLSNGIATVGAPFTITAGGTFDLPGFASTNVIIRFTPVSVGSVSNSVFFITSNAGNSTNAATGTAVTPGQIAVTPTNWNCGWVAVGSNATCTFVVTNRGGATVTGGTASISPPFRVLSGSNFTVAGFGTTNVIVQFAPTNAGAFSNNVVFNSGNGGSVTNQVTGNSAVLPEASFTASPTNGSVPLAVTFNDTSTGTITNRNWSFGDGSPGTNITATTISHTYTVAGTNTVSLVVSGPLGSRTNSQTVTTTVVNNDSQARNGLVVWGRSKFDTRDFDGIFSKVAAGGAHTVALRIDGTVVAWGDNSAGQQSIPPELGGVVDIAAGGAHTIALKNNGTVVAWGDGRYGETNVPSGLSGVVAIAGGMTYSVALKGDGTVVAWGYNLYLLGQTNVPVGLSGVVAIAAGGNHTLALKSDGTVVAWGNNGWGQTNVPSGLAGVIGIAAGWGHSVALKSDGTVVAWGDNSEAGQLNVPGGLSGVIAIAAGDYYTVALENDGTVVAWGDNSYGQTNVPQGLTGVVAIAAGGSGEHTVALKNDGTVVAWGRSSELQTTQLRDELPNGAISIDFCANSYGVALRSDGTVFNSYGPVAPPGLSGVVGIAAGYYATLALKNDGTVAAWGNNSYGQTNVPPGLTGVVAIDAGALGDSVAVTSNGTVVAWGNNASGQTSVPPGLTGVVGIAAGGSHTVALKSDQTLVAWGDNTYGQTSVPAGLGGVVAITSGTYHSLAVKSDGTVAAWGKNDNGQTSVPMGLGGVVAVAAAQYHSVALKNDGTVVAWGDNSSGQTNVPRGLSGVVAIAAGDFTTAVLVKVATPLIVTPVSQNYGVVLAGETNALPFSVINTGGQTITGTVALATAGTPFTLSAASFIVPGHQTNTVTVTFNPMAAGNFSNQVLFLSNGGNSTNTVTGTSVTPAQILVTPASTNFGAVVLGSYVDRTFIVTNQGGAIMSNGVAMATAPFSVVSGSSFALAGFGTTNVVVRFTPGSAAFFSNNVVFSSSNGGSATNLVTGTGAVFPQAQFSADKTSGSAPLTVTFTDTSTGTITNRNWSFGDGGTLSTNVTTVVHLYSVAGTNTVTLTVSGPLGASTNTRPNYIVATNLPPVIAVSPTNQDFGSVQVFTITIRNFYVTNTGSGTLSGSASVAAPFSVVSGGSYSVAANQGQLVTLRYIPTNAGTNSAVVSFTGGGGASVTVRGVAYVPTNPVPSVSFTNAALITINDAAPGDIAAAATPYPSTITVSGLSGTVSNMTATLRGFTHSYPHDVGVLLVGPGGQKIVLMANSGTYGAVGMNYTFDDNAATGLVEYPAGPNVSGTYKPSNCGAGDSTFPAGAPAGPYGTTLAVCNGASPNGTWSLFVQDDSYGDSGSIANGWSLGFNLIAPPPIPVILTQPQSLTVIGGHPATFSLTASNALSYTWRLNGTNLTDGGRISGSATTNLMITGTVVGDSGSFFSCVVSNGNASAASANAWLTVLPPATPVFSAPVFTNGTLQFTLSGLATSNYVIYVSSDLLTWKTLQTVTLISGSTNILDGSAGLKQRFYRAKLLP